MNKSKSINYKQFIDKHGYVIFRNFLPDFFCYELNNKLIDIENNWEYNSILDNGENPFITNVKREALQLYMAGDDSYIDSLQKNYGGDRNKSKRSVDYMIKRNEKLYNKLALLELPIDNILLLLGINNWVIIGITYFVIYPGSKEQEIHHDSVNQMNRYFISIPLHDTPLEMGPTIFYSDHDLKNFRKTYRPKPMEDDKSGNIGYLHNLRPHNKIQFQKARRQYQLNLSDIAVHRDITFHAGGNNHTNKTRKFLFIICDKIKN